MTAPQSVCVLGAGPSGLYTAKYLAAAGIPVTIYEKSDRILGNYKYAVTRGETFKDVLANPRIAIVRNWDGRVADDCTHFVIATGGVPRPLTIPGSEYAIQALEYIKKYYDGRRPPSAGRRVGIIGMGNVAFDILKYLPETVKEVTIFSSKDWRDSPFDNHLLRELIDSNDWSLTSNMKNPARDLKIEGNHSRRDTRRAELIKKIQPGLMKKIIGLFWRPAKSLKLLFNSRAISIQKSGDADGKKRVSFQNGKQIRSDLFDTIVGSVGFIPHRVDVPTTRPVLHTGWAVKAHGNISDALLDARECADAIINNIDS